MPELIEVDVCPASLERTHSGGLTGEISFRAGAWQFPEATWNDFPVVLLAWWLPLLRSAAVNSWSVTLQFMDGPYELRVFSDSRFACVERGKEVRSGVCDRALLLMSAIKAAGAVVSECEQNDWLASHDEDLARLRVLVEQ